MYNSDVIIQSISFRPDNVVEITYAEQKDVGDSVSLMQALMFDSDVASIEVEELLDSARELVDIVLTKKKGDALRRESRQ